jgi:apolipoprotein N-acyltransferase
VTELGDKQGKITLGANKSDRCQATRYKPLPVIWLEDFIFAGSSAALLLTVNLYPDYWFLAFISLIPFIYRFTGASLAGAVRLGFLFGLAYFGAYGLNTIFVAVPAIMGKIILGTAAFTLLGATIGLIRRHIGLNPILVALVWALTEYILIRLGITVSMFGKIEATLPVFNTLSTLFGLIIVSFIIVLINSIIFLAVRKVAAATSGGRKYLSTKCLKTWDLRLEWRLPGRLFYFIPEVRGPPL